MINFSNHVCSHCKHLSRRERTLHGRWADYHREMDQNIDECIRTNNFVMIPYYKRQQRRAFETMRDLERRFLEDHELYEGSTTKMPA